MMWSSPNTAKNSNFVRENVHNSSWRPPGLRAGAQGRFGGVSRPPASSLLCRLVTLALLGAAAGQSPETGLLINAASQNKKCGIQLSVASVQS